MNTQTKQQRERHRAALAGHARSIVAWRRTSRDVDTRLTQLYAALKRKELALARYKKTAKALTKARGEG